MRVYYVAKTRKVFSSIENSVANALRDMGLYFYKDNERYNVSKPMVVENRWGDKKLVVVIHDALHNKIKVKTRKIQTFDLEEETPKVVEYLGKF